MIYKKTKIYNDQVFIVSLVQTISNTFDYSSRHALEKDLRYFTMMGSNVLYTSSIMLRINSFFPNLMHIEKRTQCFHERVEDLCAVASCLQILENVHFLFLFPLKSWHFLNIPEYESQNEISANSLDQFNRSFGAPISFSSWMYKIISIQISK